MPNADSMKYDPFIPRHNTLLACLHGTAWDVHCCGCHSGFLFDGMTHTRDCLAMKAQQPNKMPERADCILTTEDYAYGDPQPPQDAGYGEFVAWREAQFSQRRSAQAQAAEGAGAGRGRRGGVGVARFLDLFCCQGGAAVGYNRAGFDVVGVDIAAQPRYPFEFHQADALEYLAAHWQEFDAFHASPPCQGYSIMNNLPWLRKRNYPLLILPVREMFRAIHEESGKPWVIENVYGARYGAIGLKKRGLEEHGMQAGWLCGTMFGLRMYRHRLFETSFGWLAPAHMPHRSRRPVGITEDHRGRGINHDGVGVGHAKGWRLAAEAMGVPWMDRHGTTQAIPPVMAEYIGRAMLAALQPSAPATVPPEAR